MRLVALTVIALAAGACADEQASPEVAGKHAECRRLEEHIFRITPPPGGDRPETDPARIAELVAKVPIEDIEQCATAKQPVRDCLQAATDARAIRACITAKQP